MTTLEIHVGEPLVREALSLYPLTTTQPPGPAYLAGPLAEAAHAFVVEEHDDAAIVSEVVIKTGGLSPVLLIEGEILLGAKQNRTLNVSVLCAPEGATPVPVSCVEAGRWGPPRASRRSPRHSPPRMRREKVASTLASAARGRGNLSDQAQVWSDVEDYAMAFSAASPTNALEDVFDAAEPMIGALVDDLVPAAGQQGVLVAIGGEVRGLDLFDKPSTLAAYWGGLLAGYALDAARVMAKPDSRDAVVAFTGQVGAAPRISFETSGIGESSRLGFEGGVGTALTWQDAVVHLAAFATDDELPVSSRPIMRSRRRRG